MRATERIEGETFLPSTIPSLYNRFTEKERENERVNDVFTAVGLSLAHASICHSVVRTMANENERRVKWSAGFLLVKMPFYHTFLFWTLAIS